MNVKENGRSSENIKKKHMTKCAGNGWFTWKCFYKIVFINRFNSIGIQSYLYLLLKADYQNF